VEQYEPLFLCTQALKSCLFDIYSQYFLYNPRTQRIISVAGQFVLFSELNLQGFYLPWAMLALDLLFGNPLMPDILGIVAGHLYYFLTVLHPLAGGRYVFKTPYLVYPFYCLCSTFATHACTEITLTTS
jgi:hypothetical protein